MEIKNAPQCPVKTFYAIYDSNQAWHKEECSNDPLERLRVIFNEKYEALKSWRNVGESFGISAPMARLIALKGYYPGPEIRRQLGLPIYHPLEVIGDEVPTGTQVAGKLRFCIICDRPFIPNYSGRMKCFICSKLRKKTK